jgi:hypothetical protein
MILALLAAAPAVVPASASAESQPRVTILTLPRGTTIRAIAVESPRIAAGTMSAGLGPVRSSQTYLDIGQGNRIFDSLYPRPLAPVRVGRAGVPPGPWARALARAEGAPARIEPGLLAGTLLDAGVPVAAMPSAQEEALMLVDRDGRIARSRGCRLGECPGVTIGRADRPVVATLIPRLREGDLLIAIERPPPLGRRLAIGVAGDGYLGTLESSATRIDGYALSTDLAPTVLELYGLAVPAAMTGTPIGSIGVRDLDALSALSERLGEVSPRRGPVLGTNLIIWVALTLAAALLFGRRGATVALRALAATFAWVPALLLLTAALEPSLLAERLIVGLGAPSLALVSLAAAGPRFGARAGYAAFALASFVSVVATAADVLAGSPLTSISLIGPNPDLGVRFFGIGNELEAVIGALLPLGAGAAVAAARPADPRRAVAIVAGLAALLGVLVFAPGRFGADVGAAITFPAGAAGVALAALGGGRNRVVLLAAVPALAVLALIAIDLLIGGDAHLSRTVLDAGGLDELGQVVERRVRLGARSFSRFADSTFYMIALAMIIAGVVGHRRILSWFAARPAARAGFIGGIAASVVGALANDSGALLLMVGTAYVGCFAGLAWSSRCTAPEGESG